LGGSELIPNLLSLSVVQLRRPRERSGGPRERLVDLVQFRFEILKLS
jgi:hypothetical protein